MYNIANIDCTDYKKESADFRQHLQGSPQATIQLVRACTIYSTHSQYVLFCSLTFRGGDSEGY